MKFLYINLTYPLINISKNDFFFFYCVDSYFKEDGNWYSRFYIGSFTSGSRLQIGTRFRHSLNNNLIRVFIVRIEIENRN